ncbi:uncharacterized protein LOC125315857 [Rhodamnia argentea]|uniref:Uncharacterized protein LOC125315857 n=1 Tax=Rhodamnia argentea TaxID=178133 RepID=A0ABM3HMQ7_9MYRT|nr:uncharacterized protein LOC125315857 [Rhodamnia argentea]
MHKDQLLLLLLLILHPCFSIPLEINRCTTSCGEVTNISYPFRMKGDPKGCGDRNFELACINNRAVLDWKLGQYYVHSINYNNYTITVADVGLRKGNCSSLPLRSLSSADFNYVPDWYYRPRYAVAIAVIVGCMNAVNSPLYIDTSSCLDGLPFSNFSSTGRRLYAMVDPNVSSVETACTIEFMAVIGWWPVDGNDLRSYAQIHELMVDGFQLSWYPGRKKDLELVASRVSVERSLVSLDLARPAMRDLASPKAGELRPSLAGSGDSKPCSRPARLGLSLPPRACRGEVQLDCGRSPWPATGW